MGVTYLYFLPVHSLFSFSPPERFPSRIAI
jgi:hypothetical protein